MSQGVTRFSFGIKGRVSRSLRASAHGQRFLMTGPRPAPGHAGFVSLSSPKDVRKVIGSSDWTIPQAAGRKVSWFDNGL
jgi:hypothetical protein